MKTIGIYGYGIVGKGMENLFKEHFDIKIYDIITHKEPIDCDLAIICVPTPMKEDGSCDTSAVEECIKMTNADLILIKSTVPPTTTDNLIKKYNKDICFSPEYMGESKYYVPFWKYPDPTNAKGHTFCIIGGKRASEVANYFVKAMSVDTVFSICSTVEAELTKYMENAFFATKVAFCNEFYQMAKVFGVDYKRLRENWLLDPRINKNHTLVFEDDLGFGGKCFPKDVNAIIKASESAGFEPLLLKATIESNKKCRKS